MIRKFFVNLLILLGIVVAANAQKECPEEWQAYTTDKYFSSLQPGENEEIKPEDDFLSGLEKTAVNRLLKNVKVAVHNLVALETLNVDEDAVVKYLEEYGYAANVGSSIIEKKRFYNNYTHHGCAIAYIEKEVASNYYCNEIKSSQARVTDSLSSAKKYMAASRNDLARLALEAVVPGLTENSNALFLLKVFGCNQETIDAMREKHSSLIQEVKSLFNTIGPKIMVAVDYSADVFGKPYWTMQEDIKDWLETRGIGYVTDKGKADWVLVIRSSARKYNTMSNGTQTTYYSYVDANISLQKKSEEKPAYDNKLSIKGSFLKSYDEAAYVAYKDLQPKVLKILEDNLK
ncbi:MAG: hypothetical protein J6T48_01055 [Bacteroidales bacterium]|nr:hypothetical protein [Bacteroidales bacterium]